MPECKKCHSNDYNNPSFVLMINECGHSLCKNCVDSLFARNSGPCPTCGKTLKKNTFWQQTFDDPEVEREVFIRKRLAKIYCLKEDDFQTLRAYDDYLEEFETIVYQLVHEIDLDGTNFKVDQFQTDNAELISKSRLKKSKDDLWIINNLEQDKWFEQQSAHQKMAENMAKVSVPKTVGQSDLIQELMSSNLPAEILVNSKRDQVIAQQQALAEEQAEKQKLQIPASFALGFVGRTDQLVFDTGLHHDNQQIDKPYEYELCIIDTNGPPVPSDNEIRTRGYLEHVRSANKAELAGGFTAELACQRALADAFSDLYEDCFSFDE